MQDVIQIPASKSISNRLLVLQYLYPSLRLHNLSTAKDTAVLQKALKNLGKDANPPIRINVGHAGTAMRFLTALLAIQKDKSFVLDGSERMRQRPVKILVDALRQLGADIAYPEKQGYPPLLIKGKELNNNHIEIPAHVSSQYITALMLIAARLSHGLHLRLTGKQVSTPYIEMTSRLLRQAGVSVEQKKDKILIHPANELPARDFYVEGDWSSASYFYGRMLATGEKELVLTPFLPGSLQGDAKVVDYFKKLGIETEFISARQQIILRKTEDFNLPEFIEFNLLETPDLAQTLAVTCLTLGIRCKLTGLETLKIKETDRLVALQNEIQKTGAEVKITPDSLELIKPEVNIKQGIEIATYEDHRMAMSFAILKSKYPDILIADKNVVVKSFPNFWDVF